MQVSVKVPGSCGELIQGIIGDVNFLVTCPINCYSRVTIKKTDNPFININVEGKVKLLSAVDATLDFLELDNKFGYDIELISDLTVGKGMASSTADMTAAIIAIALLNNHPLNEDEVSKILLKIEPSDGIFYKGIVAFDHIHGSFYEMVGEAFPANFLIFDYGGEIDTIKFNSDPYLQMKNLEKKPGIERAYSLIKESFKEKDIKKLGKAINISSLENQKILYKENLEDIIEIAKASGAYGVNVAHSGTLIGILNDQETEIENLKNEISSKYPDLVCLGNFNLVNGGYEYE